METETRELLERTQTKRKSKSLQLLVEQCHDLQEQLYTQVYCHRCRDIWEATRVLTVVSLGEKGEGGVRDRRDREEFEALCDR